MTRGFASFLIAALLGGGPPAASAEMPTWFTYEEARPAEALEVPTLAPEIEAQYRAAGWTHVDLLERIQLHVEAGGRLVERKTIVRRLLDGAGVQQWGNMHFGVRPTTDRLALETAYVVQEDGQRFAVEAGALQFVGDSSVDVFSDAAQLVIPFPKLRAGSTLVASIVRSVDASQWPLPWSHVYGVRGPGPIEHFEVVVTWAEGLPAPQWSTDDSLVNCSQAAPREVTCARSKIAPFRPEPETASIGDLQTYVVVSKPHSWADLARIETRIVEGQLGAPELPASAATTGNPEERLEKIYRFVADEVRYVAFEAGTDAVVPQHASATLDQRYGDCKAKVTLFLALARQVGLDAYPVLVSSGRYAPDRLEAPSWRWFDHMIACVDGVDPLPICLELTTPNAGVGELPASLRGAVALDLRGRDDSLRPHRLDAPEHSWIVSATVRNTVDCQTNIEEVVELRFEDAAAVAMRSIVRPLNATERKRWAERAYMAAMGETPVPKFQWQGIDKPGAPLTLIAKNRFEGTTELRELDEFLERDYWLEYLGSGLTTSNRHSPYRLVGASLESRVDYEMCADVKVRLTGAKLAFVSEFGSLRRSYEARGTTATIKTTLDIGSRIVEADELERLNHFVERSLAETELWLGLAAAE